MRTVLTAPGVSGLRVVRHTVPNVPGTLRHASGATSVAHDASLMAGVA